MSQVSETANSHSLLLTDEDIVDIVGRSEFESNFLIYYCGACFQILIISRIQMPREQIDGRGGSIEGRGGGGYIWENMQFEQIGRGSFRAKPLVRQISSDRDILGHVTRSLLVGA